MDHVRLRGLMAATLEGADARVLVQLPDGRQHALIRGVTSRNGEIIIETTQDAREEWK